MVRSLEKVVDESLTVVSKTVYKVSDTTSDINRSKSCSWRDGMYMCIKFCDCLLKMCSLFPFFCPLPRTLHIKLKRLKFTFFHMGRKYFEDVRHYKVENVARIWAMTEEVRESCRILDTEALIDIYSPNIFKEIITRGMRLVEHAAWMRKEKCILLFLKC